MYHFTSIKSADLATIIKTIQSKKTTTVKHTHVRNDQRNRVKKALQVKSGTHMDFDTNGYESTSGNSEYKTYEYVSH